MLKQQAWTVFSGHVPDGRKWYRQRVSKEIEWPPLQKRAWVKVKVIAAIKPVSSCDWEVIEVWSIWQGAKGNVWLSPYFKWAILHIRSDKSMFRIMNQKRHAFRNGYKLDNLSRLRVWALYFKVKDSWTHLGQNLHLNKKQCLFYIKIILFYFTDLCYQITDLIFHSFLQALFSQI